MPILKKNIRDIPKELIHDGTTHRQRLISKDETNRGNIATMNYAYLKPGKQLTPHTHPDGEEFYLFLKGSGSMLVGDTWFPVESGDFVTVPQARVHSLKNPGRDNLVFVTVRTMHQQ